MPNFFVERLFIGDEAVLTDEEVYDRIHFQTIIRDNYRRINDFDGYYKRWGAVQSVSLGRQLNRNEIQAQYKDSVQKFQQTCEQVFDTGFGKVFGRMKAWSAEWYNITGQKSSSPIAEDAMSFRGSSPLQCGLYDLTGHCQLNFCGRLCQHLSGLVHERQLQVPPISH